LLSQSAPLGDTQRLVSIEQLPLEHTAVKPDTGQVPSWTPSLGSCAPEGKRCAQCLVVPSQKSLGKQSASALQPPSAARQVRVAALHVPDWHNCAWLDSVQLPWPTSKPQRPLLPHTLFAQSAAALQLSPLASAQRWTLALQLPLWHTAAASSVVQPAVCSVSAGNGEPAPSFATHTALMPSQKLPSGQSPSAAQLRATDATQTPPVPLHVLD
jgi:hypothetical protein